jgi:hypothetical protein
MIDFTRASQHDQSRFVFTDAKLSSITQNTGFEVHHPFLSTPLVGTVQQIEQQFYGKTTFIGTSNFGNVRVEINFEGAILPCHGTITVTKLNRNDSDEVLCQIAIIDYL